MAHEHRATVAWTRRADERFTDNRYSRAHEWSFDGGITVPASSAPSSVRLPYSVAEAVDPEEALVASASSCHMLTFLYVAARAGFVIDSYRDEAVGVLTKNAKGKLFLSKITLRPAITFSVDNQPSADTLADLHHRAHEDCYIANSILAEVVVEAPAPA